MIDANLLLHFRNQGTALADPVREGQMAYLMACGILESMAHAGVVTRLLAPEWQYALADCAVGALADALMGPEITAAGAVRHAIGPLMEEKKSRMVITLAAYRAADGRLDATEVEAIVSEDIKAFMARMRG